MHKTKYTIIIIALVMVTITGIVLAGIIFSDRQNYSQKVVVEGDGILDKPLHFSPPNLAPGESTVCKINLVSRSSGDFHILLDYVGLEEGNLNEFVRVTVCCDTWSEVYGLSDLVAGQKVEFDTRCVADEIKTITIEYSIPSSVGNEAQGKVTSFEVLLSAKLF